MVTSDMQCSEQHQLEFHHLLHLWWMSEGEQVRHSITIMRSRV